jgi:hypothetical protein
LTVTTHESGTTFPATPPLIATAFSPSWYFSPSTTGCRGSHTRSTSRIAPASWIAFRPIQDRAVCARVPDAVTAARSVPWQPPSTTPPLGSSSTAKSPASSSGDERLSRNRPLRAASTSSHS